MEEFNYFKKLHMVGGGDEKLKNFRYSKQKSAIFTILHKKFFFKKRDSKCHFFKIFKKLEIIFLKIAYM